MADLDRDVERHFQNMSQSVFQPIGTYVRARRPRGDPTSIVSSYDRVSPGRGIRSKRTGGAMHCVPFLVVVAGFPGTGRAATCMIDLVPLAHGTCADDCSGAPLLQAKSG